MTDASGTTNYTSYDNRNRVKTKVTPEGTLNYTYDAHSNLVTITSSNTNGASVTYTPDQLNRVGTVTDNRLVAQGVSSATTTYSYYPVGTVQNYTYSANTVQTAYTYDTLNRLKTMGSTKAGTGLSSFAYTPYPAGNVQTVAELSGRTVNYAYSGEIDQGSGVMPISVPVDSDQVIGAERRWRDDCVRSDRNRQEEVEEN
jgi:YD repeat-containing protein